MAVKEVVNGKVRLTVRVTPEVYDKLRQHAAWENLSVNELISQIATDYVGNYLPEEHVE